MATTRSLLTSKRFAIFSIVTICFVLQLINSLPGINLNGFGIYPRSINGLIGILSAPFLHGSWWHFASNMLGLSGVIYGLWGFILCYGVIRRSFKSIVIAVVVALLYSGFVWGVLPQRLHISFESHLFGALSGLFLGYKLAKSDKLKSQKIRL